jgi:segregation and condensation protein B
MEQIEIQRAIEAILFAAGERIEVSRLSMALEVDPDEIVAAADALADELAFNRRGIRILRLEDGYQMVSSGEMADYITKAL